MDARYETWVQRWQEALDACRRKGGEASELVIMPPATPEAIAEVESELNVAFPFSFRKVVTEFSSQVDIFWDLPDNVDLPSELQEIFRGHCDWNLNDVVELNAWLQEFILREDDALDDKWRNSLLFSHVPNGDYLAFDKSIMPDSPVIYLSHEESEAHGWQLGDNFIDFMERWSLLGCPGNEDWQMMPFLPDATSGLDPYGENARKWREWFGLDFEVT